MSYTIPVDTHAVGNVGHTTDHNNIIDVLTGMNAVNNIINTANAGGADRTGVADSTTAIADALTTISNSGGGVLYAPAGTYSFSAITVPDNVTIVGDGSATKFEPVAGSVGPMVTLSGFNSSIRNCQFNGGTTTRSANPASDAIAIGSNSDKWIVEDVIFQYVNGWCINSGSVTGSTHGSIRTIKGIHNGGGFNVSATSAITAQINIQDISMQQCEVNESLYLNNVFDILVDGFNSSVLGTAGVSTVHILGGTSGCFFVNMDCGVQGGPGAATAGIGVLHIEDNVSSPSNLTFVGGVFQAGGIGVLIDGNAARLRFLGVGAFNNLGDGWQLNGTGTANLLDGCIGNTNNQGAGTAYDVNVTSTGHVGIMAFQYCSTAVTGSLNCTSASNHVTNSNSTNPGGKSTSGNAAAGW